MGAEIFAEAETGTRYGFISRSGPKREEEGRDKGERGGGAVGGKRRERKEGKRRGSSKWPFVMT